MADKPPVPKPGPAKVARHATARPPELRSADAPGAQPGPGDILHGFAVVYNTPSEPLHDETVLRDEWGQAIPFVEVFEPGAFAWSLTAYPDVVALSQHVEAAVLGRTSAGTLRLDDGPVGLGFEDDLPDTTAGRDTRESVRRRDISGCSIGFICLADSFAFPAGLPAVRTVSKAILIEITPACTWPAYPGTSVSVRSKPPAIAPPPPPTPAEAARARLALRNRHLDLLEIEL